MSKYSFDIPEESEIMTELLKIATEEKLYEITPQEDETGKDLIERAHPEKESVYVTETYMTDTNLVENSTQQQETDIDIAMRMPDNRVSRKVMAEINLQEELELIADEMKVRGENDLSIFAKKINDNLVKESFWWYLGAGSIASVIGGYLALLHWTDPIDYGVDKNLDSLYWSIDEYKEIKLKSASDSNIIIILNRLQNIATNLNAVRKEYMSTITGLSQMLEYAPKTKLELTNMSSKDVKDTMANPKSIKIISYINKYTEKYNNYIRKAIPELTKTHSYLKQYFSTFEDTVHDETGQRGTLTQVWEKTKDLFTSFTKTEEEHILDSLAVCINSLKGDIQARTNETKQLVSTLKKPIENDISKDFGLEKAKMDIKNITETS